MRHDSLVLFMIYSKVDGQRSESSESAIIYLMGRRVVY